MIGERQLLEIVGGKPSAETMRNMRSFIAGLQFGGTKAGLSMHHRLAIYIAQWAHESGGFRYDREIWDGKGAQARYDTRVDLGNSPAVDGDGKLYRGRTAAQITGKFNYGQFADWAKALSPLAPDFVANPDAANTDPWEGLGPIWYWSSRGLNTLADNFNFEGVTRKINGGTNGLPDRWRFYVRAALVLLGYGPTDINRFQEREGLEADGIAGKLTLAALHKALTHMTWTQPASDAPVAPPAIKSPQLGFWASLVEAFRGILKGRA